jgi:ATP-dependent exoDNAse (exonuclease V) beta subunit
MATKGISKFSANRGTVMHQLCEYYILSEKSTPREKKDDALEKIIPFVEEEGFTDDELRVGKGLFLNFYNCELFNRIDSVVSVEEMLYSHQMGGYAGRVDNIYKNKQGRPVILDFKSANKPKKREWIDNYYEQISAYFIAYWEMYGEKPQGGEIWISNEYDGVPQIFHVTSDDIKHYGKIFLGKVKKFHETFVPF